MLGKYILKGSVSTLWIPLYNVLWKNLDLSNIISKRTCIVSYLYISTILTKLVLKSKLRHYFLIINFNSATFVDVICLILFLQALF